MHFFKTTFVITALCAAIAAPSFAIAASGEAEVGSTASLAAPVGTFQDKFGTAFKFSMCGSGTDLCGTLLDVQGNSRTEDNLAFVNKQVLHAQQTAENEWEGTVMFDGSEAAAKVTQTGVDSIEVQGCRAAILCQTLVFNRVDG